MQPFNAINQEKVAIVLDYIRINQDKLPMNLVKRITKEMLWSATEDCDSGKSFKYKIPFWSTKAIDLYNSNISGRSKLDGLVHEHVYPRNLIEEMVMQAKNKEEIFQILNTYAFAVIITKLEDECLTKRGLKSKLPDGKANSIKLIDILSRYIDAGIEIAIVEFNKNKIKITDYLIQNTGGTMNLKK